jgi:hypothetical protein
MLASARDPAPDRCFGKIEDPSRSLGTQAFSDGIQDLGDPGRWSLEPVERSMATR